MSDPSEQIRYLLALQRIPKLGPLKIGELLENTIDLTTLFNKKGQFVHPRTIRPKKLEQSNPEPIDVDWKGVEMDLAWGQGENCYLLSLEDERYPPALKQIHNPPPILFAQGQIEFLSKPQLAIVGSRNPTSLGNLTAKQFAQHLSNVGLTITSGLALGIDAAAHQGAIQELGGTVAVLGSGLNWIYPHQHKLLAEKVMERGILISEFPINTAPKIGHFPRRNRIISGLSLGCLVIEAALKSGSLITAKYAIEQGREVFAIPGSINNPLSKGCHQLIRQGAKLVETAEDVLEELGSLFEWAFAFSGTFPLENKNKNKLTDTEKVKKLGREQGQLLKKMHSGACTSVDELVQLSGLTVAKVSSMLLELELEGLILPVPGGYFKTSTF
jgi:DNA processing protein